LHRNQQSTLNFSENYQEKSPRKEAKKNLREQILRLENELDHYKELLKINGERNNHLKE